MKDALFLGRCILAVLFLVVALALPSSSEAVSLYSNIHGGLNHNVFGDLKASQVGDLVTIKIKESTSTSISKNNNNSKSGSTELGAGVGLFTFLGEASADQSDEFTAKGTANNTNKANATITATVVEVLENGNLVIEGTQSIWQNKDENKITIRGIIRRDDIAYDNSIESTRISDATVKFDGKGPLNAKQRQGIITQILNFLF